MIRTALAFARKGLHVFPCSPCGKRPATANGLKDATTDPDVIRTWWHREPKFNIAIATGAASGFFVIDVDGLDGEAELRKLEAEHAALPPTIEAVTARGRHAWFRMPDTDVRNSASKVAPGIDVRGNGGYVLAPPSLHPTGRRYCWSVDCGPELAAAPDWLLAKVTSAAPNGSGATAPAEWRALVADGVVEGARDNSAARLAGYLLRRYVDPIITLELLQMWNATRCTPPLPCVDVVRIVNSIAGKEVRRRRG